VRVSFTANTASFDEIEETLIAGLATGDGSQGYLIFQRSLPVANDQDDRGVYLEYNDQAYSAYNAILNCQVSRDRIEVKLSKSLGNLNNVKIFVAEIQVDDSSYKRFLDGLKQVFRGEASNLLTISH